MHLLRQRGALAVQLSMAALAVGLVVGAGGAWVVRGWQAGAQLQTERAAYARALADAEAATTRAVEDARTKEQRRADAVQEIADHAHAQLAAARADAGRARAAADRLRRAADAYAAAVCGGAAADSTSTASSAPATGPGLVLADLFGRADARAGELAAAFDAAHAAGAACERAYDALTEADDYAP